MRKNHSRSAARIQRHARVRKNLQGTPARPRLNVYRSSAEIYAQVIDDTNGKTLAFASTLDPGLKDKVKSGGNIPSAKMVGKLIADNAKKAKVKKVVFDRGGRIYHGSIKALADSARENGLEF